MPAECLSVDQAWFDADVVPETHMMFKRLLILGGAALLVAGCSTSSTAPNAQLDAVDVQSNSRGATRKAGTARTSPTALTATDSTTCRGSWPITSGFVDTTCIIDN